MEVVIAETTNNYPQEGMQKSVEALTGGGRMRRSNTKKFWQFGCNGTFGTKTFDKNNEIPEHQKGNRQAKRETMNQFESVSITTERQMPEKKKTPSQTGPTESIGSVAERER